LSKVNVMHILHGAWVVDTYLEKERGFIVWAETSDYAPLEQPARKASRVARPHPFAASIKPLRRALLDALPAADVLVRGSAKDAGAIVWLPSLSDRPQASLSILLAVSHEERGTRRLKLAAWRVEALSVPPQAVFDLLVTLPADEDLPLGIKVGADLRWWQIAGKLALEIITQQRFRPALLEEGVRYLGVWQPQLDASDRARIDRLVAALPPLARAVTRDPKSKLRDVPSPRALLDNFLAITIDAFARWHTVLGKYDPKRTETVAGAWLAALTDHSPVVKGSLLNLGKFYEHYSAWIEAAPGAADDTFRLCFRLDPPAPAETASDIVAPSPKQRDWSLRYFLQAADDPSLLVPAEAVWRERGSTLKFLNRKFDAPQERLLAGLGQASRLYPPIETSLRAARPAECTLDVQEAYTFMRETALLLESSGFGVLVPGFGGKLGVRVSLKPKAQTTKGGVGGISFDSILEYDWQLALGDEPLSPDEFEKLAALKVPLVQICGQWVELRPDQIEQAIKFWEKRKHAGEVSLQEALRLTLTQDAGGTAGLRVTEVVADGWLNDLLQQLTSGAQLQPVPVPIDFHGELRPYQAIGLAWLTFLRRWGLGACLADDMGLGKTIQIIALLLHVRATQTNHQPALLICPTSVVGNWQRELARFSPDLRVLAYHGAGRKAIDLSEQAAQHDVVISSYALLHRDEKTLTAIEWREVILDEAQNIKNPGAKQAQAARKLKAGWHVALTGTPVENRLTELWSIFQFLNPGYLGSQAEFLDRLARPIERAGDAAATKRLKALVGPFILRRVKTDPAVISDLPEKNEMKVYCSLTKEQATLYQAVVRDSLLRLEEAEGINRRGLVLSTLLRLKQVCNHPAQFLGDGSALPNRSGKLMRLTEMLDEVRAVRDRALVFTQFAEMGKLLQSYLQDTFGDEVFFLYGGTPAKTRDKMVQRFQTDPHAPGVFILSIKAGGTGLNLTGANYVFHFDRWWNPAVENQATDRAFRIGQTKNVQVHKYLCAGTFEEKIDDLIERKQALAESIVGTSEAWITELSTDQLRELFTLRKDAVGD
jgi:SNF2 family DNA or RNA helicase